jgi:fumarate reductase subunit D
VFGALALALFTSTAAPATAASPTASAITLVIILFTLARAEFISAVQRLGRCVLALFLAAKGLTHGLHRIVNHQGVVFTGCGGIGVIGGRVDLLFTL